MAKNQSTENKTAETKRNPMFERGEQIGLNFLNAREKGVSKYYEITGVEIDRQNKKGELNSFLNATDLETGETGQIYVDGGIKGKFEAIGGIDKVTGRKIELIWNGQIDSEMVIDGKLTSVKINDYKMYFLKPTVQ